MIDIDKILDAVLQGDVDPLKTYIELKKFDKKFSDAFKIIQDKAIAEAQNYGEKTFKAFGAEITIKSNPGRWDYKTSPKWESAKNKLTDIEKQMQSAYHQKLKGITMVDDAGEIVDAALYSPGAENVSIKLLEQNH